MRLRSFLLSATLISALAGPSLAPALAQSAAPASAPAWWRVTKGDSEVWIIATPDFLPLTLKWDDSALQAHMQGATSVIYPPDANQLGGRYQSTLQKPVWKTLEGRLPEALYRRLSDDVSLANDRAVSRGYRPASQMEVLDALDEVPTYVAANQVTRGTTEPGAIGNTVASRARALAARQQIPATLIKGGAALFSRYLAYAKIPEADQVACVEKQAADFESGAISYANHQAGLAAWARGDVANSLVLYSFANNCSFGAAGQSFWDNVTSYDVEAVDKALAKPGKTVAVLELKPLLMSGGVLQKLREEGAVIDGPSLGANANRSI